MTTHDIGQRSRQATLSIAGLSSDERLLLNLSARDYDLAGSSLSEPFRSKAVKLDLVYKCSGRLKPFVLKMLRGEPV